MTKQDLKEVHEKIKRQMDKYNSMVSKYSSEHSPAEVDAFRDGINAGIIIMSEE